MLSIRPLCTHLYWRYPLRQLRSNDWQLIGAVVNVIIALYMVHMTNVTGQDYYAMAGVWCSATAVWFLLQIWGRTKR
jgi:hypothetical protein